MTEAYEVYKEYLRIKEEHEKLVQVFMDINESGNDPIVKYQQMNNKSVIKFILPKKRPHGGADFLNSKWITECIGKACEQGKYDIMLQAAKISSKALKDVNKKVEPFLNQADNNE